MAYVTRGFQGKRRGGAADKVPPGQYVTTDFPVLTAGPTQHLDLKGWSLTIDGEVDSPRRWTWEEFLALPRETFNANMHCVTKWTKLGSSWSGVSLDTLLDGVETAADYVMVSSVGGYTTNLPLEDLVDGKAWVVFEYEGEPLAAEHGGPARLLVPHLYLWKSAKWVKGLTLQVEDEPGFWESNGYNMYGDPWREQRYSGD